jgi:hypothetical protein
MWHMRRTIAEVRKLVKQVRKTKSGIVTIIMAGVVIAVIEHRFKGE